MTKRESKNKFLSGNWYPVEETSTTELKITGELPKELSGLFLRNGPNPKEPINHENYHPFFGDGMIHGIRVEDGKALWYKNKFVTSPFGFGPNTHVLKHGEKIYALVEGGISPVIMDSEMNFLEEEPFPASENKRFTAHPKIDADTGEMHAVSYDFGEYVNGLGQVHYVTVDSHGKLIKDKIIETPSRPMVHDCAITKNYVLIFDLPVTFNLGRRDGDNNPIGGDYPVVWNDKHISRVGLQSKKTDEIIWIEVNPGFLFHIVNSYENENGQVVLDFCRYERLFDFDNPLPMGQKPFLTRWILDPKAKTCSEEMLDDRPMEFSRVHPDYDGKQHRFGYLLNDGRLNNYFKHDFEKSETITHDFGESCQAAEPVFIPKKNAKSEDDGFVVGFVYDKTTDLSDFVVLDAQNFSEAPLARITLPQRVPFGFHGSWINLD
jgi:carotenoid cleavage dioxygenase-like enzyme